MLSNSELYRMWRARAVRVREWYRPVAIALLKAASSAGQVHLILDSIRVGFGHRLLMVGIAYRHRALPLAWTWVRAAKGLRARPGCYRAHLGMEGADRPAI